MHNWKLLVIALVFATFNFIQIIPLYMDESNKIDENMISEKFTILLFNVNTSNRNYQNTINYIQKIQPDILALEEINKQWAMALTQVTESFQYKTVSTQEDNFGIGFYSRIPFIESEISYFGGAGVPSVLSELQFSSKSITVLFTHPLPPGNSEYFHWRNKQLERIATLRHDFGKSLIIVGDLNTTSWSYYFKKFISRMKLKDSRTGFGVQASWPTILPYFLIPIDHCLVSENFIILDRFLGPDLGSDHYPVLIKIVFPE